MIYNYNSMKNIFLATIVFSLINCTSQKKLETSDIPFVIGQSTFQTWSGGREESGTGAELRIIVSEDLNDMSFEKIYFRGRAMDCELKTEDGLSALIASYKKGKTTDVPADKEGMKMQGTFELQSDEAVIAYKKVDGKLKYTKVEGVKEKAPVLFQSKPRN